MDTRLIWIILGMALVTCMPRIIPLHVITRRPLPQPLVAWLTYIPAAVLGGLLGPALLVRQGQLDFSAGNIYLVAALPTFLAAWRTKQMLLTVLAGMAAVALLRYLGAG